MYRVSPYQWRVDIDIPVDEPTARALPRKYLWVRAVQLVAFIVCAVVPEIVHDYSEGWTSNAYKVVLYVIIASIALHIFIGDQVMRLAEDNNQTAAKFSQEQTCRGVLAIICFISAFASFAEIALVFISGIVPPWTGAGYRGRPSALSPSQPTTQPVQPSTQPVQQRFIYPMQTFPNVPSHQGVSFQSVHQRNEAINPTSTFASPGPAFQQQNYGGFASAPLQHTDMPPPPSYDEAVGKK